MATGTNSFEQKHILVHDEPMVTTVRSGQRIDVFSKGATSHYLVVLQPNRTLGSQLELLSNDLRLRDHILWHLPYVTYHRIVLLGRRSDAHVTLQPNVSKRSHRCGRPDTSRANPLTPVRTPRPRNYKHTLAMSRRAENFILTLPGKLAAAPIARLGPTEVTRADSNTIGAYLGLIWPTGNTMTLSNARHR
jgi:hypothetical protein